MYQSLVEYPGSPVRDGGKRKHERNPTLTRGLSRVIALTWGAVATCVFALDANVDISEGRNPLVQAYMVKQEEKQAPPSSGNSLTMIERASGPPQAPFFTASEAAQCREKPYRFCRDFSQSEFRVTSLRFMVPEVPGLSPRSLTIRRNSIIANYTFR